MDSVTRKLGVQDCSVSMQAVDVLLSLIPVARSI
jgi:hypothetical protein